MAYLGTEHRDDFLSFELAHAARKLVTEILPVSPGDNVVITGETASDSRVIWATAQAAYAAGGHPIVIIYETFPEPSIDPPKPVQEALKAADIWYEFAVNYLLYTDTRIAASKAGCKHTSYEGMDVDMMVRTIGKPDYPTMHKLGERLRDLCNAAKVVRITDPNGTDLICPIERNPPQFLPGTGGPGQGYSLMLGGQSSFSPNFDETNGTIVFDGCLWPPSAIGPLVNPVALTIERGVISKVEGGHEARVFERWLESFNSDILRTLAHTSFGFNPGVKRITGRIVEDERVFGCLNIGFGPQRLGSPSHTDGVILRPSIWADAVEIEREGKYVHPELAELSRALGME